MLPENSAAVQGMMSIRRNTRIPMRFKIIVEPKFLRRSFAATPHSRCRAIRIQHHDVPHAEIVTVITFARFSGLLAPILKIRRRSRIRILMISQRRPRAILEFAPGRSLAIFELGRASMFVSQITGREHRSGNFLDEFGGRLSAFRVFATGNVARTH